MLHTVFAFLQAQGTPSLTEYGVSTGIAGFVIYLWRQDRKDRDVERKAQDVRYSELAADFRRIVQDNTAAITSLKDAMARNTNICPFASLVHTELMKQSSGPQQ
jgi:hypothetical protein